MDVIFICQFLYVYDINDTKMLNELISVIRDTCLRHKLIKTFKYQAAIYNNAQNSNKYLQAYVDDVHMSQLLISTSPNIFTITFDLYILGFVDTEDTILNVQDKCYDTALQIIMKLGDLEEYKSIIEVHDYSLLTLSHYTDDNSAGVKATIELRVPIGMCDLDDYFNDEPYEDEDDEDIEINLNPIELPKNPIKENCR